LSSFDNPQFEPGPERPMVAPPTVPEMVSPQPTPVPSSQTQRDPVWSGWDVLLIVGLTVVTLIVIQIGTAVAAWLTVYRKTNLLEVQQKPALALIGQFLSYVILVVFMAMLVEGKYKTPFWQAIRWNWPANAMKMVGLSALGMFTIFLDVLGRYLPMPKTTPFDQFFAHPSDAYLMAIFAVTLGPLFEELLFRGFLYPVIARRTGTISAVFLTSLLFGLIHYLQYRSLASILIVGLVGVVLTTVRVMTKSVAASFIVHVGYNATLMLLAAAATDGFRHMEKAALG